MFGQWLSQSYYRFISKNFATVDINRLHYFFNTFFLIPQKNRYLLSFHSQFYLQKTSNHVHKLVTLKRKKKYTDKLYKSAFIAMKWKKTVCKGFIWSIFNCFSVSKTVIHSANVLQKIYCMLKVSYIFYKNEESASLVEQSEHRYKWGSVGSFSLFFLSLFRIDCDVVQHCVIFLLIIVFIRLLFNE